MQRLEGWAWLCGSCLVRAVPEAPPTENELWAFLQRYSDEVRDRTALDQQASLQRDIGALAFSCVAMLLRPPIVGYRPDTLDGHFRQRRMNLRLYAVPLQPGHTARDPQSGYYKHYALRLFLGTPEAWASFCATNAVDETRLRDSAVEIKGD